MTMDVVSLALLVGTMHQNYHFADRQLDHEVDIIFCTSSFSWSYKCS